MLVDRKAVKRVLLATAALAAIALTVARIQKNAFDEGSPAKPGHLREVTNVGLDSLRRRILSREGIRPRAWSTSDEPQCVLVDWRTPDRGFTLVTFSDGVTNLYFHDDTGVVNAQSLEAVRAASTDLREQAARLASHFTPTSDFAMPGPDEARFFIVDEGRTLGTGPVPAQALVEIRRALAPLARAAWEVVGAIGRAGDPERR